MGDVVRMASPPLSRRFIPLSDVDRYFLIVQAAGSGCPEAAGGLSPLRLRAQALLNGQKAGE